MRFRGSMLVPVLALAMAGPVFAGEGGPTPEERAALFAKADTNGDGVLSPDELERLGEIMREEHAKRRFARLDQNGDGVVSAEEFASAKPPCHHRGGQL